MENRLRLLAVLAAVCTGVGCGNQDSNADAAQAAASPTPLPAHGNAVTADDLARLDLPLYPTINPGDTTVSRTFKHPGYTVSVVMTTFKPFKEVADWYQAHLDEEFVGQRFGSPLTGQRATYSDTEPDTGPLQMQRNASIDVAKDSAGGQIVIITLQTNSTSDDIEKPDWHKD